MKNRYRLEGKTPILCSLDEWATALTIKGNAVEKTRIGDVYVSTVFLGIDHSFTDDGPPILFETMIFGGPNDQWQERYFTWDEALAGHNRVVALLTENPNRVLD